MIADTDSKVTLSQPPIERGRARAFDLAAWNVALGAFVASRVVLVVVGLLAAFYILPLMAQNLTHYSLADNTRIPRALWLMWHRFDSGFYVDIAKNGYWPASTLHGLSNWVFYPLYPLLMRPIGLLLGGSDVAYNLAGLLVGNLAALASFVLLYKITRLELGPRVARHAVILLALFPTSFYLSAIYPFSLFLALSAGALYAARRRHWTIAALCGGLGALTRAQGLLLLVPLLWEYWQAMSDRYAPLPELGDASFSERARAWAVSRLRGAVGALRDLRALPSLLSFALVPLGTLLFMLYARAMTGDLMASSHDEIHWGRHFVPPWTLLWHSLTHVSRANPLDWNFWLLNNAAAVLFLLATLWAFRSLPIIYALYTLAMVLSPISSNSMQSLGRYYVVVFPVVMLLALWSGRGATSDRRYLLMGVFTALQAVFMIFFVLALPSIA